MIDTPGILRLMILLLIFVSVLLIAETLLRSLRSSRTGTRAINRRLKEIARHQDASNAYLKLRRTVARYDFLPSPLAGMASRYAVLIASAGLRIDPVIVLLGASGLSLSVFLIGGAVSYASLGAISLNHLFLLATLAAAIGWALPYLYLRRIADKRKKRLLEQFPPALDVFIRGLRAGHPAYSALQIVSKETADPLGTEIGLALDEVNFGADIRSAMQDLAERCDVEDIRMFVVCLGVQAETGGNLAEILGNLATVIRDRASMYMKVRALSSEGRATGMVLTVMPILLFCALFFLNPKFYLEVAGDPYFLPGFVGLLIAFLVGVLWIRRLVNLKV